MEANNSRQRIEGSDFVKGGVYEVYDKGDDRYPLGIYFYPTSYPDPATLDFEYNSRGALRKFFSKKPLELLLLYRSMYSGIKKKGDYAKLDKSKIYGKIPVSIIRSENLYSDKIDLSDLDLSYAKLEYSHLVRVNLSNMILSYANLSHANLTGANFTGTNLTRAKLGKTILKDIVSSGIIGTPETLTKGYYFIDGCIIGPDTKISSTLSDRYTQIKINGKQYLLGPNVDLTGANLTGANLTFVNLTGDNLTRAILTGTNLTRAILTGANLTGATIIQDSLSEEQTRQIIGEPNYIDRIQNQIYYNQNHIYFSINKNLSNGNRISIKTGQKLNNTNFTTQHRISFTRLFNFLLQKKNQVKIATRLQIVGEGGIDYGGITLIIFQKCYEEFMKRYFYPYETEDNSNYVVLKDLSDEQFEEFKQACEFMILLAKKVENQSRQPFQILIPILVILFNLLIFEGDPETFFELGNKNIFFGKKENGRYSNQHKLNNPYNFIAKNINNNNNNNHHINNNNNNNHHINNNNNQNKVSKFNNFSEDEQRKLMFLMLLKQNHIQRRKQYETMKKFIDEIFKPNEDSFTTYIDYSYDAFVKRLKFKLSGESNNRNLESFKSLEIARIPLIQLLLEYIQVSDDYRMVMTAYVCGSYCYTGDIKISIFTNPSKVPFQSHTCFQDLHVFITPTNPKTFNWVLTQNKNNKNNKFSPIEKLYNTFLDKTTQIA